MIFDLKDHGYSAGNDDLEREGVQQLGALNLEGQNPPSYSDGVIFFQHFQLKVDAEGGIGLNS